MSPLAILRVGRDLLTPSPIVANRIVYIGENDGEFGCGRPGDRPRPGARFAAVTDSTAARPRSATATWQPNHHRTTARSSTVAQQVRGSQSSETKVTDHNCSKSEDWAGTHSVRRRRHPRSFESPPATADLPQTVHKLFEPCFSSWAGGWCDSPATTMGVTDVNLWPDWRFDKRPRADEVYVDAFACIFFLSVTLTFVVNSAS